MAVNRGPEDPSVLYLQSTHISSNISSDTVDNIIHVKRSDNLIWVLFQGNDIHRRVLLYLYNMGFYGVLQCGYRVYDNHLITALVERWRRETHTFHFRCGEATITLQDVSVIWGLKIDGEPVTGVDYSHKTVEWQNICMELLGFEPIASHFKGGHLSMTALYDHCMNSPINNDSSEEDVIKYSRCAALMIIGGIMLPDYQGGSVRLMFLQLLRDINQVNSYSWGSAVLAFLYRQLCNASQIGKCIITGPLYILQIWAWSKIKCVSPDRYNVALAAPTTQADENVPIAPYGAQWISVFSYTHAPTHAVRIIRDCFDRMNNDEFNWTVYNKDDIDVKIIIDSYDNKIWRCICPLICFDIVEMHRPNRVMRQFKLKQPIPVPAVDNDELHSVTRIGHRNTDWKAYHKDAILLWNRKLRYVVRGERHGRSRQTDDDYLQWYEAITVRIISPPVHGVGFRPYPYDISVAGQHHTQQNFSTPSPDSHRSSFGQFGGFDVAGPSGLFDVAGSSGPPGGFHSGFDMAGPSRPSGVFHPFGHTGGFDVAGPSGLFDVAGSSGPPGGFHSGFDMAGPSRPSGVFHPFGHTGGFDVAGPSGSSCPPGDSVDLGYQTPFFADYQSFTDLLNDNRHQNVHDHHVRNVVSPIPFLGYSADQNLGSQDGDVSMSSQENNPDNVELGRGRRVRKPTDCGTGGHLHY